MNLEPGGSRSVDARLDNLHRTLESLHAELNALRAELNRRLNTLTVIMVGGWATAMLAIIGLYLTR